MVFTATDSVGLQTSCPVAITVAECLLLLGAAAINQPLGNPTDLLLTSIDLYYPVTMESIPVLDIPNVPALQGLQVYAQVGMYNPPVFPNDPLQMSHGLEVTLGSGTVAYGSGGSGITVWMPQPPLLGTTVTFAFQIPGM